jgi:8-amino-7-oxononanoate synthase
VYTNPVVPPGVAPNNSLLRTSYMATHTKEHLDRALAAFKVVGERLDLLQLHQASTEPEHTTA